MEISRDDIVLVSLDPERTDAKGVIHNGSEQGKTRPALVIQNDISNKYSPITIVAPITTKRYSKQFPTNVEIDSSNSPLKEKSTILLNQIRAIDKSRVIKNYGRLSTGKIKEVNEAIKTSLGLE